MLVDLDAAFEDFGGVPSEKAAAIEHLQQIPISASLRRRYLRAWSERTKVNVDPADYEQLASTPRKR